MNDKLDGVVCLVTGASSGIGAAASLQLAAQGAAVALVARRGQRLQEVREQIESAGGRALVIEADITDQAQAAAAVEETVSELGRLDVLVNNAGLMLIGELSGGDLRDWTRMVEINLMGALYCTEAALPHLISAAEQDPRRVADVVNLSSVSGRLGRARMSGYNLTKWGLNGFSEALRQELCAKHVRVGLVEPGAVATELLSHNPPEIQAGLKIYSEIETMVADDVADVITFMVTRPRHQALNEILMRPTEQV